MTTRFPFCCWRLMSFAKSIDGIYHKRIANSVGRCKMHRHRSLPEPRENVRETGSLIRRGLKRHWESDWAASRIDVGETWLTATTVIVSTATKQFFFYYGEKHPWRTVKAKELMLCKTQSILVTDPGRSRAAVFSSPFLFFFLFPHFCGLLLLFTLYFRSVYT